MRYSYDGIFIIVGKIKIVRFGTLVSFMRENSNDLASCRTGLFLFKCIGGQYLITN